MLLSKVAYGTDVHFHHYVYCLGIGPLLTYKEDKKDVIIIIMI